MNLRLPRWAAASVLLMAALTMMAVTQDAEARRMGGGNFGRQSSNITSQRQAVTPPAAQT
ncbi:MAG: Tim44 domain-containing protein, partial [Castellaniella sp.]